MANDPSTPGDGFLGWLGRQIGYVTKAVKTDVTAKQTTHEPVLLHREVNVAECQIPGQPHVTLRRTTIDEAIVTPRLNGADQS